jgi:hypothetical protein
VAHFASDQVHIHQVGIAVPFRSPRPDGFPSQGDLVGVNAIEDRLDALFKAADGHLFAMVITTNGMREFVLYTKDAVAARAQFNLLRSSTTTHDIQLSIQADPEWKVYRSLSTSGS